MLSWSVLVVISNTKLNTEIVTQRTETTKKEKKTLSVSWIKHVKINEMLFV